jgi:hypothetical protein
MEFEYLEYLPQKVNLIEGMPAYKYGEWPGIKSSKWTGSLKVYRPRTEGQIFDGKEKIKFIKYYIL